MTEGGKPLLPVEFYPLLDNDMKVLNVPPLSKELKTKGDLALQRLLDECSAFESWPTGMNHISPIKKYDSNTEHFYDNRKLYFICY